MLSCISLPFTKLVLLTTVSYTSPNDFVLFFLPNRDFREYNRFFAQN